MIKVEEVHHAALRKNTDEEKESIRRACIRRSLSDLGVDVIYVPAGATR